MSSREPDVEAVRLYPNCDASVWLRSCEEEVLEPLEGKVTDRKMSSREPDVEAVRLYPNCDASVWLRSCEEEVLEPLEGKVTGCIPGWVSGTLLRNGPGSLRVGDSTVKHLFDSAALLHRFSISDGGCRYQCRFLQSESRRRNMAARRVVLAEFGTAAVPDPCHTIFDRVSAMFTPGESMSDNAMISVYPFGDEMYAFTEGPVIHRIDQVTLETTERRNLGRSRLALLNHTSHPHVMPNGDVYNIGMSIVRGRLRHVVVKFPYKEKGDMFESAQIVGGMKPRWPLHPSYMHTFGVTASYFVVVEQPLTVSLCGVARAQLAGRALASCLKWYPDQKTHIVLISRRDGKEKFRFSTDSLFFLHIINTFESGDELVLDLCSYKDPQVINAMYVEAMENMQSNAEYASWFRARPRRLRLPLVSPAGRSGPAAPRHVPAALLADVGTETPTIHYALHNGRPYRYFYAISSDVDADNPGTMPLSEWNHTGSTSFQIKKESSKSVHPVESSEIIKVDTVTGEVKTWSERGCYPSEPVFVPAPHAQSEDDGVVLSALVWSSSRDVTGLLVLNAQDLREEARALFPLPSPAPKCLHGWFLPDKR